MPQNSQQIISSLESHKAEIRRFGVAKVGLFGSFARNEQSPDSDIDLLVEFASGQKNYRNFLGFSELAENLLGRKVEVVTLQSLSQFIAPYVTREVKYVQVN